MLMVITSVSTKKLFESAVDCYGIFIEEASLEKEISFVSKQFFPNLHAILEKRGFKGRKLEHIVLSLPSSDKLKSSTLILVGLGNKSNGIDIETYRRALGKMVRTAIDCKSISMALALPQASLFGEKYELLAKETALIADVAAYHFDDFITDSARKQIAPLHIMLCVDTKQEKAVKQGVELGTIIAHGINKARHWIDLPPIVLNPPQLADKAAKIAKDKGLLFTQFSEEQINKMGMGGLSAVSRGSELDCRLIVMEYKTKKKGAPTVAFVGKGITFDSGGLSIKPARGMESMKCDMSGAAAVIATMEILAELKPEINVVGIAPLSENLPSGNAIKPGDIVTFYNGKTAEIKNTDAEGRLILADALSYAVKHYKLDAIIDLATLTGAISYALGPFYSGLFSQHDDLVERIYTASEHSGDAVWRLPMGDDYKQAIISTVADICNIGNESIKSGSITAAHFLEHFVADVPWAHLDIAGTAYDVPNVSYYRSGATGVGIRLLVELAMNWK